MRTTLAVLAAALVSSAASAQPLGGEHSMLKDIAGSVSEARQRATIEALVGFGTRHTLSETKSDKRGIGAARRWVAAKFGSISKDCGGKLTVATPSQTFTNNRVPTPTEVMDVLAIQKGTTDPGRVIVISSHLDSRVTDVMNATADAPGANDDASGVAAVIEAARVLCRHEFPATLVFAALSGEEQGLLGGKVLADYAVANGWKVEANLNNDIVGNTEGVGGVRDNTHVRVFSEGTRTTETPEEANRRRYNGGEVDSPSRNLARYLDTIADRYLTNLDVVMVYRTDRFGRGGDQVEMLRAGFPAVRVTEAVENYTRQHQDLCTDKGVKFGDTIDGVDFAYAAKLTALNAVSLAGMAWAPPPPAEVTIKGAVSADTTLSWQRPPSAQAPNLAGYKVYWRLTTEPTWTHARYVGNVDAYTLENVVIDNYFFGVAAVARDGSESPVVFPGAAGSFGGY